LLLLNSELLISACIIYKIKLKHVNAQFYPLLCMSVKQNLMFHGRTLNEVDVWKQCAEEDMDIEELKL